MDQPRMTSALQVVDDTALRTLDSEAELEAFWTVRIARDPCPWS